jgi:hypothetical protein
MALWGNKDSKTATGTIAIATNGTVTGTSTLFTTEARIGDHIRADGRDYVIVTIATNTSATVKSGINGGAITAVSAGASYTLSEKPVFVAVSESAGSPAGVHGDATKVFGVDVVEAGQPIASGVAHSGWVRRIEGTGGRAGRVITEVLVAGGSITGDQDDDAVFPDRTITITSQPEDSTADTGSAASFSVTATVSPTTTLAFLWQVSTDDGDTFASAPGTNNAATYTIADNTGLDGNLYRVIVSATGAISVTSNAARLIETTPAAPE